MTRLRVLILQPELKPLNARRALDEQLSILRARLEALLHGRTVLIQVAVLQALGLATTGPLRAKRAGRLLLECVGALPGRG